MNPVDSGSWFSKNCRIELRYHLGEKCERAVVLIMLRGGLWMLRKGFVIRVDQVCGDASNPGARLVQGGAV